MASNLITVKGERAIIYRCYYYKKGINIGKPTMIYAGVHILKASETFNNLYYKGSGSIWQKKLKWKGALKSKASYDKHVKVEVLRIYDGIYIRQDVLKEEGFCIAHTIQKFGDKLCVNRKKTDIVKYGHNDTIKQAILEGLKKQNRDASQKEISILYKKMYDKVRSFGRYHNWCSVSTIQKNSCYDTYENKWGDLEKLLYQNMLNKRVMPLVA